MPLTPSDLDAMERRSHRPHRQDMIRLLVEVRRLQRVEAAARVLVQQFVALQDEQYKKLVKGQTFKTASENWMVPDQTVIDFNPLVDALAGPSG